MNRLHIHLLPELVSPEELAGSTLAVIDVLRATTTITAALARGSREVVACLDIDDAKRQAGELSSDEVILGGERGGLPIEGFDLGNSPAEYTRSRVEGKTVVFTTTNGTKAMFRCRQARRVLMAGFVNLSSVCRMLQGKPRVDLICAGTHGEVTREDTLLAGAIVDELCGAGQSNFDLNDQARIALGAWQALGPDARSADVLTPALEQTRGGRNLISIGMQTDIALAAQVDQYDIVPELDVKQWRIRAAKST